MLPSGGYFVVAVVQYRPSHRRLNYAIAAAVILGAATHQPTSQPSFAPSSSRAARRSVIRVLESARAAWRSRRESGIPARLRDGRSRLKSHQPKALAQRERAINYRAPNVPCSHLLDFFNPGPSSGHEAREIHGTAHAVRIVARDDLLGAARLEVDHERALEIHRRLLAALRRQRHDRQQADVRRLGRRRARRSAHGCDVERVVRRRPRTDRRAETRASNTPSTAARTTRRAPPRSSANRGTRESRACRWETRTHRSARTSRSPSRSERTATHVRLRRHETSSAHFR